MKLTVSIQGIHSSERLLAPLAGVRSDVEMQLLVSFAIVLPGKALAAAWPLALIRFLLSMRSQVS